MKAKAALTLALATVLLAQSLLFSGLSQANFTPLPPLPTPIYIHADGTVDPASAPIQRVGDTYTLTGDINNTIEIQRSNIVLNGGGFILTKPDASTDNLMIPVGWLPGVQLEDLSNVEVRHFMFDGCGTGVTVKNVTDITVSYNTIRNCGTGVVVLSSSDVDIVGNSITIPDQSFAAGINLLPSTPTRPTQSA